MDPDRSIQSQNGIRKIEPLVVGKESDGCRQILFQQTAIYMG